MRENCRGHSGRENPGLDFAGEHRQVAIGTERGEQCARLIHGLRGSRRDPTVEETPEAAQATDTDAKLVHVLVTSARKRQCARVALDLLDARSRADREGLGSIDALVKPYLCRPGRRRRLFAPCEKIAPFGLAAHVEHQPEALAPSPRDLEDDPLRAPDQFDLEFADIDCPPGRENAPLVEGEFDHAAAYALQAHPPANRGLETQLQRPLRRPRCRTQDPGGRRARKGVPVETSIGTRGLVLLAADFARTRRLQRLQPAPALPANPKRHARARERPVRGVEVPGLKSNHARLRARQQERATQRIARLARHRELQFELEPAFRRCSRHRTGPSWSWIVAHRL